MSAPDKQPSISMSAVAAAGLASATAALLTSRFGVAGTIIGAALTTMIITGGSAILKAYLESVSGKVRRVPGKVREKASRVKEPRDLNQPNLPGRQDLRNNFMGRLRGSMNWFFNLSTIRKRYILSAALVPAVIAFLIGMGTVTGVELASGKSLSCSVWSKCPASSTTAEGTNTGTRPSLLGGGSKTDSADVVEDPQQAIDPAQDQQAPSDSGVQPAQPANPQQNATPDPATPDPATPDPATPDPATPDPATPDTPATPAPEDPAAQEPVPQDPVVEEPPPEEAPSDPPAPETPAPADPSGDATPEPTPSEP